MKKIIIVALAMVICLHALVPCLAFEELSKGSKGDAVVELQNRLNELGYTVGTVDGDFGGKTEKAIKLFQADNELEATGRLDETTYSLLFLPNSIDNNIDDTNTDENARFLVKDTKGLFGYCDSSGEVVIPCQWFDAGSFIGGVAKVQEKKDGYIGYINTSGEYIIPCEWEDGFAPTEEGYVLVYHDYEHGFNYSTIFDRNGNVVMSEIYCYYWPYIGECMAIYCENKDDTKTTYIFNMDTKKTRKLVDGDATGIISNGLILDYNRFLDFKGNTVIDLSSKSYKISTGVGFKNGLCKVIGESTYKGDYHRIGFIDATGELVIPCQFVTDSTKDFSEGLAVTSDAEVGNNGLKYGPYGFIDTTGKEVIPLQFKGANSFHEGLAAVQNSSGLWGFIDKNGNQVIDFLYNETNDFNNGFCLVTIKNKSFYIDKDGNPSFPYIEGDSLDDLPSKKDAERLAQENAHQAELKAYKDAAEDWLTEEWSKLSKIEIWETKVYVEDNIALVYITYSHGLNTDWKYALITVIKEGATFSVDRSNSYSADSSEMQSIISKYKSKFITVK